MAKLTESQLVQKELIDALRTVVRLKHRAQMRRELNDIEDRETDKLQKAITAGTAYELPVSSIMEEVDG